MASKELLTAQLRRRHLAESHPQLGPSGKAFLEEGRWGEAVECFSAAKDLEGAALLAAKALEAGDLFYYRQAQRILGREPAASDLAQLAENASSAGKAAFAASARKSISDGDDEL